MKEEKASKKKGKNPNKTKQKDSKKELPQM
jgi:hypothetical protein